MGRAEAEAQPVEPFAVQFKRARQRLAMTQEQIAHALEVTLKTVQAWEAGRSEPRLSPLRRVCELFGWPPPYPDRDSRVLLTGAAA